jgi:hypothetical protein
MRQDGPAQLPRHAQRLVRDAVGGLYPTQRAYAVLGSALRAHGHLPTHRRSPRHAP